METKEISGEVQNIRKDRKAIMRIKDKLCPKCKKTTIMRSSNLCISCNNKFITRNYNWIKGKKIDRNKYPNFGHFKLHSEETKRIMSKKKKEFFKLEENRKKQGYMKGRKNPVVSLMNKLYKTKPHSKEWNNNISKSRAKQILPVKDTSIELKIQEFLTFLHIEYIAHKYMSEITHAYQCDIFIPVQKGIVQKTIIECDGCFFHACPICNLNKYEWIEEKIKLDNLRTKELQEKGFRVIRLWEHEINSMNLNKFNKEILIKGGKQ